MKKIVIFSIIIFIFASFAASAYQISYYVYGGQASRERRLVDPYSRDMYFLEGYVNPFGGYGSKGPVIGTQSGMKSAYSGTHNLVHDGFSTLRNNPNLVSNYLSSFRGFTTMDAVARLAPLEHLELIKAYPSGYMPNMLQGTARVLSLSNNKNVGLSHNYKQGKVFIHVLNLPPLNQNELYEFWLVDLDTEYPLSMGMMQSRLLGTGYFSFEIQRPLIDFDMVMITVRDMNDLNPWPDFNKVVLVGEIEK